jgi:DNA-binding MarR family transcriptional regulator
MEFNRMGAKTSAKRGSRGQGARPSRETNNFAPEQAVGHLIRIVQVRLYQLYYERLAHLGVSPGAFGLLATVWAQPGIQHGELAQALAIRGPNLTKLVDQLVREGLVERRTVRNDRRTAGHYLTDRARPKVERVLSEGIAHDVRITRAALSSGERRTLLKLLAKLASKLEELAASDSQRVFKKRTRTTPTS